MKDYDSSNGPELVNLIERFNSAAWDKEPRRPPLVGNGVLHPRVYEGADYWWRRVEAPDTSNGSRWVPAWPLSERAKIAWWDNLALMQELMPAVYAWYWARQPHSMEPGALRWIARLNLVEARCIAALRIPKSQEELRALEDKGWVMPRCKSLSLCADALMALRASIR